MTTIHISDYDIEVQSSGHLACKQHGTIWDKHVKMVVVNHLDAMPLWADVIEAFDMLHKDAYTFMVPFMPEMEVFAQVELREAVTTGRVLYLVDPRGAVEPYRLGVLFPGEGRNVARNMIYQWFVPQVSGPSGPVNLRCKASSHRPEQQVLLEKHLKDEAAAYAEKWLLLFTDMCRACNVIKSDVANFVPSY